MDDSLLLRLVEEFVCDIRSGRDPDPEEYAALHPKFAERIREIFPTLLLLENAAAGAPESPDQRAVSISGRPARRRPGLIEDTDEDPPLR